MLKSIVLFSLFLVSCQKYIIACENGPHSFNYDIVHVTYYVDCARIAKTETMGDFYTCKVLNDDYTISTLKHKCKTELIK